MAPSTRKRKVSEDKLIAVKKKRNQKEKSDFLDHSQSKSKRKTSVEDETCYDSSQTIEKSPTNKKSKSAKSSKHVAYKATPEVKEAKLVLPKVKIKQEERGCELEDNETVKKSTVKKLSKSVKGSKHVVSETPPELKEAKILLSKVKVKQEESDSELEEDSFHSTDSGIVSEISDVKDKSSFSVNCKSDLSMQLVSSSKEESKNEASSSESEWEEVEEREEQSLDDYNPVIPKEGVEITIDCPDLHIRKRKKKQFDWHEYIRLYINRERKDAQLCLHKTHLLCLLAHGFFVNDVLNSTVLKGMALSLIPDDIFASFSGKKVDKIDINGIENLVSWFNNSFSYENETNAFINLRYNMIKNFERKKSLNASEYNLMFIVIARTLGFKARFCVSFYPITYKAQNLLKKPQSKERSTCKKKVKPEKSTVTASTSSSANKGKSSSTANETPKIRKAKTETKGSEAKKEKTEKMNRPERSKKKSYKISSDEGDDDDRDEDFKVEDKNNSDEDTDTKRKNPCRSRGASKTPNRKVLSSDSEPVSPVQAGYNSDKIICWAEVFSKSDKQWVSVDCVNKIVNKPYDVEKTIPKPVTYILAYDNYSNVKDVTRRYCAEYMTCTLKLRVDPDWWEETLEPFLPPNTKLDKEEEKKLDMVLSNKPLPTTVAGFKNHPLYALKRHLLKFEGIYPPDAPTVGFLRGEPIYPRECVVQLHSRETWIKEARVVRVGEEPYKIVKARPKWDRIAGIMRTDLPLELFGHWQTDDYEPPVAKDGKVPRNEYGNVELFKPCMLPKGTVHLQIPGLNRIARKLGIDCSPAVVGFDGHKGSVHPVFDGFIICKEYKDTILAAWEEEQENARKREEEKRKKRIYGNWKKLIRGLLIRERIKLKYDTK